MKKFIMTLLIIACTTNSYGRVIRTSRSYSRPRTTVRVSKPRPISKPKIVKVRPNPKPITHKAKPIKTSTINSIKPKETKITTTKPTNLNLIKSQVTSTNKNIDTDFKTTSSNFSNETVDETPSTTIIRGSNNGLSLFDYMMLNKLFNNNNDTNKNIETLSEMDIDELIKYLEKEIKEEEFKLNPDKNKIKKYKELIKKLKEKKL